MSTDVRDRLKQAALEPAEPLDVTAVYRRGRRMRRLRQASLMLGLVALVASAGLLLPRMDTTPVPFVGSSQASQSQFVADGWVSFREYRIAAGETAACLNDEGLDSEVMLDESSGRLAFGAAEHQPGFDGCYEEFFAEIDEAWAAKIGPDTGGVSWAEYHRAVEATVSCLTEAGWEARAEPANDRLMPAYGFVLRDTSEVTGQDSEQALDDCQRSAGLTRIQLQWADQIGPSAEEDRSFYEIVARCLRASGVDIEEASPDALTAANREHPDLYEECRDQAQQEYRPYG